MKYEEKAAELFLQGYNCSQAVFGAFCDKTGLDERTALRMSSSLGGGVGRMREVCGAVTGMALVAGCLYGYSDPKDQEAKAQHYRRVQEMAEEFKAQYGSVVCRELLGLAQQGASAPTPSERTPEYYRKRSCLDCVKSAAAIMEKYIEKNGDGQ